MIYRAYTQFNNYIPGRYVNFILFCREYFILIWIFFFCYEFSVWFCCEFFILFWQLWTNVHFFGFPSPVFFLLSFRIYFTSLHHFPTLFTLLRQFFYFPSLIPYFLSAFSFFTSLQHFCFSFFTLPSKSLLSHTVLLLPPLSVFTLIYANQGRQGCCCWDRVEIQKYRKVAACAIWTQQANCNRPGGNLLAPQSLDSEHSSLSAR